MFDVVLHCINGQCFVRSNARVCRSRKAKDKPQPGASSQESGVFGGFIVGPSASLVARELRLRTPTGRATLTHLLQCFVGLQDAAVGWGH